MSASLVVLIVAIAIVGWAALGYNGLVSLRNQVQNGWRQIDVQLRRRHDLIPNLVEAERKQPEWPKDAEVHLSERSYGTVRRSFSMPEDASAEGIKATYRDGVLEVTVAKKPEAKPTRIKVNVEN